MNQNPSENELTFMIGGYWISQAIAVVAKLGIADHLKIAPKSYLELAELTHADANSLYRLL